MLYSITDWNRIYENHQTRVLKRVNWVPVRNQMDDEGYLTLVDHPDGPIHFAAWIALLEIASRCPTRGTLARSDGTALTPRSLAVISRLPAGIFEAALPRLVSIGWISQSNEQHGASTQESRDETRQSRAFPQESRARIEGKEGKEQKGIESNGREANGKQPPSKPEFWELQENRTQWMREQLLGFVEGIPGWSLPPPDDALCQRILALVEAKHTVIIGQALKEIHGKGKRPADSWGWFPVVLEEWLRPKAMRKLAVVG